MTTREWKTIETHDDGLYYTVKHLPCGTNTTVYMGGEPVCPNCQPDEWEKQKARRDHA